MEQQNKEKNMDTFIQQHYLTNFNGPVLFTAPHSKTLNRGGQLFDIPTEIHKRQKYAGWIAMRLAVQSKIKNQHSKYFQNASFMVWGTQKNQTDFDPNYLKQEMFQQSVFSQGLHTWANSHPDQPLFHIDVHGKSNSNEQCSIQIGTKASYRSFDDQNLIKNFDNFFHQQLADEFIDWQFRAKQCKFNSKNPRFKGSWGNGVYTMSDQSARIGIPSIQMQIPLEVRQKLFEDDQLIKKLHRSLFKIYRKVIVPYWKNLSVTKINKNWANLCLQTVSSKQIKQVLEETRNWEIKRLKKNEQQVQLQVQQQC